MARITVEQVKELRAKATPGPWRVGLQEGVSCALTDLNPGMSPIVAPDPPFALGKVIALFGETPDAELAARAKDMAELIEELAAENAALKADIEQYVSIANELATQNAELKAELAAFVHGFRITIPTAAMEQEFATHYRRGYEQGKRDATVGK